MTNEKRHEDLCHKAMDDLNMTPEKFGELLHNATARRMSWDPESLRIESAQARGKLLNLPYGWELFQLERQLMGVN